MEYSQELVDAVEYFNEDEVQKLVGLGADVNCKDIDGESVLVIAARWAHNDFESLYEENDEEVTKTQVWNYIRIYKTLHGAGADTTGEDNNGHTARYYLQKLLWKSTEFACLDVVAALVGIEGIDVNLSSASGCTPFCHIGKSVELTEDDEYYESDESWCGIMNLLYYQFNSEHAGSCVSEVLYRACRFILPNTVKKILSIPGIDVNYRQTADKGKTPIMILACFSENMFDIFNPEDDKTIAKILSLLIDHGADITLCDQNGVSVSTYLCDMLHESVSLLQENVTKKLLEIPGVDVNYQDQDQCEPISQVGKWFHDDDHNYDSYHDKHVLRDERCANIYDLLLSKTNNIPCNALSESLYRHVQLAHTQTVKKLLTFPQVDVNCCFNDETPIMTVASKRIWDDEQSAEIYDVLIQAGALLYSESDKLWKSLSESLHEHVRWGKIETIKKLLQFPQVDVNCCLGGKTPIMVIGLDWASDQECAEIYDVLVEKGALNYSNSNDFWGNLSLSLHRHVKCAETQTVKKLLECSQVDVNCCWEGKTPIMHIGLFRGSDEECAELYDVLIKRGALNYSKPDELWKSLSESLHRHVEREHTRTVKKLLTFPQVDVNCCLDGKTPIMIVSSQNLSDEQCVELYDVLIQAGALNYIKSDELWKSLSESLHKHVECARTQTLKRLLKFPEVNVNCCLDGKTPIMVVCSINSDDEKCAEMYDVLIQAGALTYSKSDELWNSLSESLHKHVARTDTKTVKTLLTFPQVDVTCCLNGKTPIMLVGSEEGSDEECAELYDVLIDSGALNYSKSDKLCEKLGPSLHVSVRKTYVKLLTRILNTARVIIDVNWKDYTGYTPIMIVGSNTAIKDDTKCVEIYDLLAKNGADLTAVDQFGKSVREYLVEKLESATQRGHLGQMEKLCEILGVSNDLSTFPNSLRKTIQDQLICKSEEGNAAAVKKIMQFKHLDVNHSGEDGNTAVMVVGRLGCTDKECSEIYDVLISHENSLIAEDKHGNSSLEYLGEAFVEACARGHSEIFKSLLKVEEIDNTYRYKGMTPLTAVGLWGGTDDACQIIYDELLLNTIDRSDEVLNSLNKAFHTAATKCWYKVLKRLMREPCIDPNKIAEDGTMPLTVVAKKEGSDENCYASYQALLPMCDHRILERDRTDISEALSKALWNASTNCWPSTVQLLVNIKNVDVNFRGENGTTPIMAIDVASENHLDDNTCSATYSILLERCDINAKDNHDKSTMTYLIQALRKAASLCYPKVCQVILSHVKMESVPFDVVDEIIDDFDINDEDDRRCAETYKILLQYLGENCQCGETMPVRSHLSRALMKAAKWGWHRVVEVLTAPWLIQNALIDINHTDESNRTAIMNLDWVDENFENALAIFKLLLDRGADLTLQDYTGTSVSDIISSELCKAVKLNRQSKLKVLIDFPGININFKENGKVPLMHIPWHHEIFEDCLQIEKLLLARNANLDEVDCQGISARLYPSMILWRAIVNGAKDVAVNILRHERVNVNYQHNVECKELMKSIKIYLQLNELSVLHVAALACCPQIVNMLIQRGANPLAVDGNGRTARALLDQNYPSLLDRHKQTATEILNILYYEEKKLETPMQEQTEVAVSYYGATPTQLSQYQMLSTQSASGIDQGYYQENQYDSVIHRPRISDSEIYALNYTGQDVFDETVNHTSERTWQEDKFKIHSFHKEDNMYAAIENVTVTAINSMDMNGPQEFVVKAVDNDQLLPVSTAKTLLPFGMEKESLLSVENETVSVNEMKKIDYVNRGSTSDDSCKYASQHAYGFQSGSSLSHHTSLDVQNAANRHQVSPISNTQQLKENESNHHGNSQFHKQHVKSKGRLEDQILNRNIEQKTEPSGRKQNHREITGGNQHRSHTISTPTSSERYNFNDPIKMAVSDFITKSGFHYDRNIIVPSLKRMENTARSMVRCLIGVFFSEEVLATSSVFRDYSKYAELDHNIVEKCIAFVQQKYTTVSHECILDTINQKCADARRKPKFKPKTNVVQFQIPRSRANSTKAHMSEQNYPSTNTSTLTTSVRTSSRTMPFESHGDNNSVGSKSTFHGNCRSSRSQSFQRKSSFSLTGENCHFATSGQNSFHFHNCTINFNNTKCQNMFVQERHAMANADSFTGAPHMSFSTSVPPNSDQSSDSSISGANNHEERKPEHSVKRKPDILDGETEDHTKKQKY